jgi:hypothetical protein
MSDLEARADRVRAVTEANFGKVISRDGDVMTIEVPADIAPGLATIWGMGRFVAIFIGQTTRPAPRRIITMQDRVVACDDLPVTTAFYRYRIDLEPRPAGQPAPLPGEITRMR